MTMSKAAVLVAYNEPLGLREYPVPLELGPGRSPGAGGDGRGAPAPTSICGKGNCRFRCR